MLGHAESGAKEFRKKERRNSILETVSVRDEAKNRLSATITDSCSVHMDEQGTVKYSYKFSFGAAKPDEAKVEADKGEVQSYINELLGLDSRKAEKNRLPA